ncbi:efflux RND transporter periplasmic adaptor subunit [Alphaproteobacteria bacterium]|nr:efflux RND transporter periplasmic adaptor subunit [Alphaproteobacteria bacterium]
MNFPNNKKFISTKNILLIFGLVLFIFSFFRENDSIEKEQIKDKKPLFKVEARVFETSLFSESLILRGFTEASRMVTIKSQVEGKISSLNFVKGMHVKAGKQILLIDPEDKVAKVKEMEALLDQRKKEYEVAEKLFKKGFRSELNLSKARVNFEKALATYEKSQVELNNTKIIIPFDSFLENSFVELGDYLKKGDEIVKIVDLDPIFLTTTVSEKYINQLKFGQKGEVFLKNGYKDVGKINYISATADPQTKKFEVQVELKNSNKKIFSGVTGEVTIKLDPKKSFFIPSSIISLDENGDIGIKTVADNNVVKFLNISIISDTGSGYWINSEDRENITVITRGQDYALEGDIVDIEFEK